MGRKGRFSRPGRIGYARAMVRLRAVRCIAFAVAVTGAALDLAACASAAVRGCAPGQRAMVDTLYLGTDSPAGPVTDAQWQAFLGEVVTPRFPDGLTTWRADGQWRGEDGRIVLEGSHVLQIVRFDAAGADDIAAVADEYKRRFRQEAVLRLQTRSCASF